MALSSIVAPMQLRAMADLARKVPFGAFAEVGVFNGGSAEVLYQIALAQGRELHLFDTFTGTPVFTEGLDKHKVDDEFAAPGALANIRRVMPTAYVYPGTYPLTNPGDMPPLAFVHCDCDQYLSYKAVIELMWPKVVPGGVLLFDDYPYLEGAKRAVEEAFDPALLKRCFSRFYAQKPL